MVSGTLSPSWDGFFSQLGRHPQSLQVCGFALGPWPPHPAPLAPYIAFMAFFSNCEKNLIPKSLTFEAPPMQQSDAQPRNFPVIDLLRDAPSKADL